VKLDPDYQAYLSALGTVVDLPRTEAAELDEVERRGRSEVDALDRTRRDAAERWAALRDNSSRLSRRVDELAGRVGASPPPGPVVDLHTPSALPDALEALRSELEQADQAWGWVLRHRERRAAAPVTAPPPPPPTPVYPPAPQPAPEATTTSMNPKLLLAVAAVLIVVLVIVVIVMAV
jgi:hypothetical protein